jgi:hypothetical protein
MASYQDYGQMLNNYYASKGPGPTQPYFDPQAEVSGSGQAPGYSEALKAYQDYNTTTGNEWLSSLSPEQRSEYDAYHQQAVDANAKKARTGALIAFGAPLLAAGAGAALGAGGFGSLGSAAGLGGATSFPVAGGSALLADIPGGLTAGLGGASAVAAGGAATAAASSPWSSFLSTLTGTGAKAGGNLLSQLISAGGTAYQGQRQAGQYNDVINTINNLYSPDSPYAQQMQQALARKDSAAGRNSQYGSRAVELAAALTQAKSNTLTSPGYGNLMGVRGTAQNQGLNALGAFLGGGQGQDLITKAGGAASDWLGKMFGNNGNSYSPGAPSNGGSYADWFSGTGGGG